MEIPSRYLGGGVYVAFDGWRYMLTTGTHIKEEADNVIYLEPQVMDALSKFVEHVVKGE